MYVNWELLKFIFLDFHNMHIWTVIIKIVTAYPDRCYLDVNFCFYCTVVSLQKYFVFNFVLKFITCFIYESIHLDRL